MNTQDYRYRSDDSLDIYSLQFAPSEKAAMVGEPGMLIKAVRSTISRFD